MWLWGVLSGEGGGLIILEDVVVGVLSGEGGGLIILEDVVVRVVFDCTSGGAKMTLWRV